MKNNKFVFTLILLTPFMLCVSFVYLHAEVGVGVGVSPWSASPRKKREEKKADIYVKLIAKQFNAKEEEVEKLWKKGYGRNEIIKLLTLQQKSNHDLKDLIKQRDKNIKLSRMAEKYKVDYPGLLKEAETTRKKIDYQVLISTRTEYELMTSSFSVNYYSSDGYEKISSSSTKKK
ncbi:MAG: hypothetical protein JW871_05835 [Endomicrobiales bacterium]|nr:hypothetical protein [Endomicrobiales bacterium]